MTTKSATPKTGKPTINKPPVLFEQTQDLVERVEKCVGGTFLGYWGSVCHNDVVVFYEILRQLGPQKRIALFIKSSGGTGRASLRIINLLRQYTEQLVAIIPLECASAATMMALGADEIQMGPLAYLTAIDTSLTHDLSPHDLHNNRVSVSQDELHRVIKLWSKERAATDVNPYHSLFQYVHPLVIGAVDRASSLSIMLCKEILSFHMRDGELADRISNHLNSDYPSHAYPIMLAEARRIGLNVTPLHGELNDQLLAMSELYSEMCQRAITDYDELNYHDNEIENVLEGRGIQIFYQTDKDWHYRKEERRWVPMNDKSSWRKVLRVGGKVKSSVFHIR